MYATQLGFKRSMYYACLYFKLVDNVLLFMLVYVDDILLISPMMNLLCEVKSSLRREFEMKDLSEPPRSSACL